MNVNTTNVAVTSQSGYFVITLKNNGNTVASRRFSFYRSGDNLYPSDPGIIQNWANNYPNVDNVYIRTSSLDTRRTTSGGSTATVEVSTVYQGDTKASSSTSWNYEPICYGNVTGGDSNMRDDGCDNPR